MRYDTMVGVLDFKESEILTGEIIGFESYSKWAFLPKEFKNGKLDTLQSLEDPNLFFWVFDLKKIGLGCDWVILTIPGDITQMTMNTRAPLIFSGRKFRQEVLSSGSVSLPAFDLIRNHG